MREIKPIAEMSDQEIRDALTELRAARERRRSASATRSRASGNGERTAPKGGGRSRRAIEELDIDDSLLEDSIEELADTDL